MCVCLCDGVRVCSLVGVLICWFNNWLAYLLLSYLIVDLLNVCVCVCVFVRALVC